jgi:hypothetical protein
MSPSQRRAPKFESTPCARARYQTSYAQDFAAKPIDRGEIHRTHPRLPAARPRLLLQDRIDLTPGRGAARVGRPEAAWVAAGSGNLFWDRLLEPGSFVLELGHL